jgi:hypothetical protein
MKETIYIFSYEIDLAGTIITADVSAQCSDQATAQELAVQWLEQQYPESQLLKIELVATREV